MPSKKLVLCLMLSLICGLAAGAQAAVTLLEKGQAKAVLVVPEAAIPDETIAANELQSHIAEMSGVTLEIVTPDAIGDRTPILIGRAAPASLMQRLAGETKDQSAFVLKADNAGIAM